jgi:hypothetical protein
VYSWFQQSNFGSFTAGGGQGATGAQGVTGYSPNTSYTLSIPPSSSAVADSEVLGSFKIATYKIHASAGADTLTSTVDLLGSTGMVKHTVYAELGKVSSARFDSGSTGGSALLIMENRTSSTMAVTILKTVV